MLIAQNIFLLEIRISKRNDGIRVEHLNASSKDTIGVLVVIRKQAQLRAACRHRDDWRAADEPLNRVDIDLVSGTRRRCNSLQNVGLHQRGLEHPSPYINVIRCKKKILVFLLSHLRDNVPHQRREVAPLRPRTIRLRLPLRKGPFLTGHFR